ncbi:ABC transporter ATP-binding protein [Arthrobacter sp. MA-N2]|uniref:ABC transporter ATP-binding protein n=1 Tax=Arthrobacter sp. MA-N2 TaxID=1101188 RepID=UPI0004AE34C3|nr:ATP-binding cassette domain-containing protein [Arthrobacter sp. MA-N2]
MINLDSLVDRKPDTKPVLDVRGLKVQFGGNIALDTFDLQLWPKDRVGLIGPNGAGKSTCVNAITGYVKSSGDIRLGGVNLASAAPHKRSRAGLVRTFQNLELFLSMTVEENIWFGAGLGSDTPVSTTHRREALGNILSILGLERDRKRPVSELAYGTRKVVELGRALVGSPRVLLLDEPMAGLDTSEKAQFVGVLRDAFDKTDSAILLIEHDMFAVEALTDTVCVLDAGRLIASGSFLEVSRQQTVIDAYLGA